MTTSLRGYTVIEVMIVLAVTMVLFFSVVTLFSGRQGKTQFKQSMFDLESAIQSYANQVSTGTFPDADEYSCQAKDFGSPYGLRPYLTAGGQDQGTSQDCLYVGRVIQAVPGASSLYVYNVLGLRESNGQPASSLSQASPEVALNDTASQYLLMDTYKLLSGTTVHFSKNYTSAASGTRADLLQLYNSFQNNSSNAQAISASVVTGYDSSEPSGSNVDANFRKCIELNTSPSTVCQNPAPVGDYGWQLCVHESGSSGQQAELTVKSTATGITTNLNLNGCTA